MIAINDCPAGANEKKTGSAYTSFVKKWYFSSTTKTERPVNILLPAHYTEAKKYPVMYFLHGIFGDEDSMTDPDCGSVYMPANLVLEGLAKEMILVCPNIYAQDLPDVEKGFHQDYFHGYNNFIKDLTKDLMPFMEASYSIATGREHTAVCGFSMGGRTALYIVFSKPELFGYVGAFAPAPGIVPSKDSHADHIGLFKEEDFRIKNPEYTPYITFISCGTKDSVVGNFPKSYHEILTKNQQPHTWVEVPDADHDNRSIRTGLYNFMTSVFQ
ncbi:alpha/beta hydrolase [[Clostridium] polysaccharolyticum]|uniref:Enterochelin esterase n=1 Tax=[Clostridium] polysaccharolyticum TaxID=29364 RepID=A0A1I0BEH6_9FIRM|nr:alpha/beta hydrolase-fold protein [[Clostridium] polysaccharolyticum]SET05202.1 Enterochelin esterase [[Clostridium] polysaccharolyticum]